MESTIKTPATTQFIVNVEDSSMANEIRRAIKMIKGVSTVRIVTRSNTISPALAAQIAKARKEYRDGDAVICRTPEELDSYFASL